MSLTVGFFKPHIFFNVLLEETFLLPTLKEIPDVIPLHQNLFLRKEK